MCSEQVVYTSQGLDMLHKQPFECCFFFYFLQRCESALGYSLSELTRGAAACTPRWSLAAPPWFGVTLLTWSLTSPANEVLHLAETRGYFCFPPKPRIHTHAQGSFPFCFCLQQQNIRQHCLVWFSAHRCVWAEQETVLKSLIKKLGN